jgi:energy-coupling factor transporter transmembrane protein EcfT
MSENLFKILAESANPFGTLAEIMLVSYYMSILIIIGIIMLISYFIPRIPFKNIRLVIGLILIIIAILIYLYENSIIGA